MIQSMVDASATCRMNPLATLGMDRSSLMRESLHVHSGIVYPGLKAREGAAMPAGYVSEHIPDLHYKHDVSLENRKPTNGFVGLYKNSPPGLQKPLLMPAGGGDSLGLEKRTDLGLNAGSSYLRLPWMSPYPEAGMYPFLDSPKYAAFSMYKTSLMSQTSPYLSQHLAYQSLCARAGGNATGTERIFYMPPYTPAPISTPLAPPMRSPTTVATTPLSQLVHSKDKSLQSLRPRVHHEASLFGQQLHQQQLPPPHQPHEDKLHSSKTTRVATSKGSSATISGRSSSSNAPCVNSNSCSVDSTTALLMQPPHSGVHHPQTSTAVITPPPPAPLIDSTLDFQKPMHRGLSTSSSLPPSSMSHSFYMSSLALEHSSSVRVSNHKSKPKDVTADHKGGVTERKSSKTPPKSDKSAPSKDLADKPLDLSAKMDFGTPNGCNPKLEALAKMGHSSTPCYELHPSQELLKETLPPPTSVVGTLSKPSQRPEIISTLHSSWVVPGPIPPSVPLLIESRQNEGPLVIKNKNLERVTPQQRSSSCPRIGDPNSSSLPTNPTTIVVTSVGRPASASPSPSLHGERPKPSSGPSEKASLVSHTSSQSTVGKPTKVPRKPESQETNFKPQHHQLENGHTSNHHFITQNETCMAPSLPCGNRYLPYSVPESMSLGSHIPLPTKGLVYPHPILLGNSSLYPSCLESKHGVPYGLPAGHGDLLTYHDSQEMVHPLMSPHSALDPKSTEQLEERLKSQEHYRPSEDSVYKGSLTVEAVEVTQKYEKETEKSVGCVLKLHNKPLTSVKHPVQDDTDGGSERDGVLCAKKGDPTKPANTGNSESSAEKEPKLKQLLLSNQAFSSRTDELDRQQDVKSKPKSPEQDCLPCPMCQDNESTEISHGEESPAEHQTQRCARTSGDRTSEEAQPKTQSAQLYADLNKEPPKDAESHKDDDECHSSSKTRRSSLAKRIANSSGYVGDRFKCITTELYADSSKLSREQRALQRAMLRFSELELKEREGGATAVATAAGELDTVPSCEGAWDTGQEGVGPARRNSRTPVLQRCAVEGQSPPSGEREDDSTDSQKKNVSPPEDTSLGVMHSRKRPWHREEGEELLLGEKRPGLVTDDWPQRGITHPSGHLLEEVNNLKVRIALKGLRLRKPHPLQHLQELWKGHVSTERSEVGAKQPSTYVPASPSLLPEAFQRSEQAKSCPPEVKGCSLEEKPTMKKSDDRSWCEAALCKGGTKQVDRSIPAHVDLPSVNVKRPSPQKHRRQHVKDHQRAGGQGAEQEEGGRVELTARLRRHGDPDKPKGKRQCKTKHLSLRERWRALHTAQDRQDLETNSEHKVAVKRLSRKRPLSLSERGNSPVKTCTPSPEPVVAQSLIPQPSPALVGSLLLNSTTSRLMPPEARRLIVNKNAGETLLQRAARLGYEEVVLYCLENKVCDVNHRDNAGYCALHEACARGWLSIVQHLVEHGADINCSAQDGTRPLHDAVENDHLDVVRLLLSYGADPTLATYSGHSLLKMTHSDVMECFLIDYFADLRGREDDDPGLYWELYGSSVCEPAEDLAAFDVLANPPGPSEEEEEEHKGMFEFELSDRPLLPCYNIQVSLSQGPRNWLLLSDVLKRLRMSSRAFRASFAHIEVATISEAEFYKQASLSQLFSCPEELEAFLPDSKELLDLVEISAELVTLLGSTLECLDHHWNTAAGTKS